MLLMTDVMGKSELFAWHYTKSSDIFFIHKNSTKTHTCLEFGDIILDIDRNHRLLGMEILWASEFFGRFSISPEFLGKVDDAQLQLVKSGSLPVVQLNLRSGKKEQKVIIPTAMAVEVLV